MTTPTKRPRSSRYPNLAACVHSKEGLCLKCAEDLYGELVTANATIRSYIMTNHRIAEASKLFEQNSAGVADMYEKLVKATGTYDSMEAMIDQLIYRVHHLNQVLYQIACGSKPCTLDDVIDLAVATISGGPFRCHPIETPTRDERNTTLFDEAHNAVKAATGTDQADVQPAVPDRAG